MAANEYVMVYVPGVDEVALIAPVEALIDKPVVLLNVPPVVNPLTVVGFTLPALAHIGEL